MGGHRLNFPGPSRNYQMQHKEPHKVSTCTSKIASTIKAQDTRYDIMASFNWSLTIPFNSDKNAMSEISLCIQRFDAIWLCLSVAPERDKVDPVLWFDAIWLCLSVGGSRIHRSVKLWFDAIWLCLSVPPRRTSSSRGCDLMLFDYVFQLCRSTRRAMKCCDLMLFDYVFQSPPKIVLRSFVVIWCYLTMSFSNASDFPICELVVIWCYLTMSFSETSFRVVLCKLWFDAIWLCLSVVPMLIRKTG